MISSTIQYLIESTLYLTSFLLLYKFFLSRLTYFTLMRMYLLVCLGLGFFLPLISLPVSMFGSIPDQESLGAVLNTAFLNADAALILQNSGSATIKNGPINVWSLVGYGVIIIYISGALYKLLKLTGLLLHIRSNIRKNPREKQDKLWFIYLESRSPAYSFFNYIFINRQAKNLSINELENICFHESIHAKQYHTLDILFVELISTLFWFNPLITLFKQHILEVHEYLADEKIIKNTDMKKSYSQLLLKLSTEEISPILSSAFSAKQISRRISMIGKTRSGAGHRFSFLLMLPAAAILLLSFSSVENRYSGEPVTMKDRTIISSSNNQMKVGLVTWTNNTLYTDDQLTERLGIKSGDTYSKEYLEQRLYLDEDAINSLYLDKGYLFFQIEVEEIPNDDGTMDLTISFYEGLQAHIRKITIVGNGNVPKEDVLKEILIQEGELFSKTKLIESIRAIARMDLFEPENIQVNPIPIQDEMSSEFAKVDIEFRLIEK